MNPNGASPAPDHTYSPPLPQKSDEHVIPIVALGSSGSGKTYILRAIVSLEGLKRQIHPELGRFAIGAENDTSMRYDFGAHFYHRGFFGPKRKYSIRMFDTVGGDVVGFGSDHAQIVQDIRAQYGRVSMVLLSLDPKDVFASQAEREDLLMVLGRYLGHCLDQPTPPFVALCLSKCDEYGLHYAECGRLFPRDSRIGARIKELHGRNDGNSELATLVERTMERRVQDPRVAALIREVALRSGPLLSSVLSNFDSQLGINCNLYLTSACPHVRDSAQLSAHDSSVRPGPSAPARTSAGVRDLVLDWQEWVCDRGER